MAAHVLHINVSMCPTPNHGPSLYDDSTTDDFVITLSIHIIYKLTYMTYTIQINVSINRPGIDHKGNMYGQHAAVQSTSIIVPVNPSHRALEPVQPHVQTFAFSPLTIIDICSIERNVSRLYIELTCGVPLLYSAILT